MLLAETPRPATVDERPAQLAPCERVLMEGFCSGGAFPRIEVRRTTGKERPHRPADGHVIAIAADHVIETPMPVLDLDDAAKIAALIACHFELP